MDLPHKAELERMLRTVHKSGEFQGKDQQFCALHTWGKVSWEKIFLVGMGRAKELTRPRLLRAAAVAARKAARAGCRRLVLSLPVPAAASLTLSVQAQSIAEGVLLGVYSFDQYKVASAEKQTEPLREVLFQVNKHEIKEVTSAVRTGQLLAQATNYARDIANQPGNVIYPSRLAEEAIKLGRQYKMRVTVWNRARLEKEKFGGILAVGAGSEREPRFIRIDYNSGSHRPVVLVGKAITFDSGGISIKPSDKMDEMKFDKCGGVAVFGAMRAIAALQLPIHVVGLIASAENMPSATSYRPGDIVTTYSGKTVEVLNTDAEGRIVLGDALSYAGKLKPQAVIDLATLTGACVVALGSHAAGLFSNNDRLTDRLRAAADATGERLWPFPLWDEYHEMIKSPVADIKNTGGRYGGAITAAAFLQKFISDTPWAHLDIAGTAWITEEKSHLARGGTAFGVRLLVELLRNWKPL